MFACVLVVGLGGGVHVLWTITVVVGGRALVYWCVLARVYTYCALSLPLLVVATYLFGF